MAEDNTCPSCGGDGELATSHKFTCYSCNGKGVIDDHVKLAKVKEQEKEVQRNFNANLSAWEYRQMGG